MSKRRGQDAEGQATTAAAPAAPALSLVSGLWDGASDRALDAASDSISTDVLPVPSPGDGSVVLAAAAAAIARGVSGAMATVLERHGSAPGTPGQKLYVSADGTCVGTVGGGAVERAVQEALAATVR